MLDFSRQEAALKRAKEIRLWSDALAAEVKDLLGFPYNYTVEEVQFFNGETSAEQEAKNAAAHEAAEKDYLSWLEDRRLSMAIDNLKSLGTRRSSQESTPQSES